MSRIFVLAVFTLCALSAYAGAAPEPTGASSATALATAQNSFGLDLLRRLAAQAPHKNVFISPVSAHLALSMACVGSDHATRSEMRRVLAVDDFDPGALADRSREYLAGAPKQSDAVTVAIANSLWTNPNAMLRPEYLDSCRTYFDAEVRSVDFGSPLAARRINAWVDSKTRGHIKRIVDRTSPSDALYIVDAVYFKAKWLVPFDKSLTKEHDFTTGGGGKLSVPMMSRDASFDYTQNDRYQAVRIPYSGGRYQAIVLLPMPGVTLGSIVDGLDCCAWQKLVSSLASRPGSLSMPRVKIEWGEQLNDVLKQMGMRSAFQPRDADFSRMSAKPVFISAVVQKTTLNVDEEATEASAATSVGIMSMAVRIPRAPFTMVVDRPYLFAVLDRTTGAIPFIGAIDDPGAR